MTSLWKADDLAGVARQQGAALPVILPTEIVPMLPGCDAWDMWQLRTPAGETVHHRGRAIWFFLAAPRGDDPDLRHDVARIRTLTSGPDGWHDHGATFPEDLTPGNREWSGSAVLGPDGRVTHHFTAAGRRGEPLTFEQRLFETCATLDLTGERPAFGRWSDPAETVRADGRWYLPATDAAPHEGRIKGFRDPGYFRDPADDREYLVFTASAAWVREVEDGVIGLARREGDGWALRPPLIDAIGINSELERAHVIAHGGLLYLFWSTQRHRFAPELPPAPTGLYGMVAEGIDGQWRPLNGTGLVAANPAAAPTQAYCWWVTGELEVMSFVDMAGCGEGSAPVDAASRRRCFGGTAAPPFTLRLEGDRAWPVIG